MKAVFGIAFVVALVFPQVSCAQTETDTYPQKILLKNWALSRCLGQVYTDPKVKGDAATAATASAYLESGHQSMDTYQALSTLVDQYAKRKISGSIPSDFNTMKCIDLFNSKELDELTEKWVMQR